jgi:hypothetical protein
MDAFFTHAQELLSQGYIQVLIGIYVAAQAWWWVKKIISMRHKPTQKSYSGTYSVIVVAYRPDPTRLTRTLKSIVAYGSPVELIVAIDNAPKAPKKLKSIAAKYATRVIESASRQGARELYAKASVALKKRSDIIITVAPGAVWDESTPLIATPFNDERVGAVSGHEVVVRPVGFVQHLGAWLNRTYFTVIMPFQGVLGSVRPLSPHIMAVRREFFTTSVSTTRNETFLGRRVLTAYNESITANVLMAGKRAAYQPLATVAVPTPETFAGLRKTYLQRYRGNLRSLLRHTKALSKTHPLVTMSAAFSLFSPAAYISLATVCVFLVAYDIHQLTSSISTPELVAILATILVGYLALSYLRHNSTVRSKKDALWLPAYVLVGGLVLLWAKTVALFTFAENARDSKTGTEYGEGKVGRARTAAAAFAVSLFAITLPVAYAALVGTQNVPLSVITSQQGRPYSLAREYAARLNDDTADNDPSTQELLTFMRANGAYYGQQVNEDVAKTAYLCVRDTLKTSSLHGALDNTQACYAHAVVISQENDPHTHIAHNDKANHDGHDAHEPLVKITAKAGDTLTWLIRAEVKKADTKKELSAAQAVYIETTYLSQTDQLDRYMDVGEQAELDLETIEELTQSAKRLSAQQLAAWEYYAQNILW